jgi:hypothetical protein
MTGSLGKIWARAAYLVPLIQRNDAQEEKNIAKSGEFGGHTA